MEETRREGAARIRDPYRRDQRPRSFIRGNFGLTPSEYARFKQLKRENLRDHMTDLELIFSMLGEAATTEIARNRDAQGFPKNKQAARAGGEVAGKARKDLETKSGRKVMTSQNYLSLTQGAKKQQRLAVKPGKLKGAKRDERSIRATTEKSGLVSMEKRKPVF